MAMRIAAIAFATLVIAAPATAQTAVSAAEAARAAEEDRVVCKSQKATGTRFEKKTCMTVKQWEAMREQNRRDAKDMIDRPEIETRRGG